MSDRLTLEQAYDATYPQLQSFCDWLCAAPIENKDFLMYLTNIVLCLVDVTVANIEALIAPTNSATRYYRTPESAPTSSLCDGGQLAPLTSNG